jgi:hypothetical protein
MGAAGEKVFRRVDAEDGGGLDLGVKIIGLVPGIQPVETREGEVANLVFEGVEALKDRVVKSEDADSAMAGGIFEFEFGRGVVGF